MKKIQSLIVASWSKGGNEEETKESIEDKKNRVFYVLRLVQFILVKDKND